MTDIPQLPTYIPNRFTKDLPAYLKDPANYDKIQKVILESFAGKHSHGEVLEWASCPDCQKRFTERAPMLKKLGFKNPAQYFAWKKTMETIQRIYAKFPYMKDATFQKL